MRDGMSGGSWSQNAQETLEQGSVWKTSQNPRGWGTWCLWGGGSNASTEVAVTIFWVKKRWWPFFYVKIIHQHLHSVLTANILLTCVWTNSHCTEDQCYVLCYNFWWFQVAGGKTTSWPELEITGTIKNLSPALWRLQHLTALYLNDNSLFRIPPSISLLQVSFFKAHLFWKTIFACYKT